MNRCAAPYYTTVVVYLALLWNTGSSELIQNGGFENNMANWYCYAFECDVIAADESRFGAHSVMAHNRTHTYQGPTQRIHPVPGKVYRASSWAKILNDKPGMLGQTLELMVSFEFPNDERVYITVVQQPLVATSDGWVFLQGDFQAPSELFRRSTFYYQGPDITVDYAVDLASITEISVSSDWRNETDANIEKLRKSDITVNVNAAEGIDRSQVQIRLLQTRKSFPFGTCVNSFKYVDPARQDYRDFIHQHFNWGEVENALKWKQLQWFEDHYNYERALKTVHGLRENRLKVRGHNMVWSNAERVPDWVRTQSGDQLRNTVRQHIEWTLNITHGLLEHWDVNNENLHGHWFQNRLNDRDYDLELFRMMYQTDPNPKLFLNDYNVVGSGAATSAYREQAQRFKDANVHLYGIGVQSHFFRGVEPNPALIKNRLDILGSVGLSIWTTELDVYNSDENVRADWYEKALRALYGHPAMEGILFWAFCKDTRSTDTGRDLVNDSTLALTVAGRRVFDLLENQWMTDETRVLSQSGDRFTVRGFHGDYELRVVYQGKELSGLTKTFTLEKTPKSVQISVHT